MFSLLAIILFFVLLITSAFYRMKPYIWLPGFLIYVMALYFTPLPVVLPIILMLLWIPLAVLVLMPTLRQRLITAPVLHYVARTLPPMSETERIAVEAGDVGWEGELFQGQPRWDIFLKQPLAYLTDEERIFLAGPVETLCQMINTWEIQEQHEVPATILDYLKKERFFGLIIHKKYGGCEFSAWAHSCIITKIASRSIDVAVTAMVPNSLGPAELLQRYGTPTQKNHYLPRLARGEEIPCFGLTSLHAGSDANAMRDYGVICRGLYEGQNVVGIRLNWDKRYITLAPIATLISVAFRLSDPDHLLGQQIDLGITLALIPMHHSGVQAGHRHWPMFLNFMNGPCCGENVFIPLEWVIGEREGLGQGWRMLMECLSIGRSISLPALSAANGKMSYRLSGIYAHLRQQFNLSIGAFEGIQQELGEIAGYSYWIEALRSLTASAVTQGLNPSIASAITKYQTTELGRKILNKALDIHGGRGVQAGPRNYLAQAYLGIPISITVEGANILTRNLMIFGQGAFRCHPYLKEEIACAQATTPDGLRKFDRIFWKHVGYTLRNLTHVRLYGVFGARYATAPQSPLKKYYRELSRMSASLAFLSDVTMLILGGTLKRKENISARLGDMLSHLYAASAILKFYEAGPKTSEDCLHAEWGVKMALYNIQEAIYAICANFPVRPMAGLLRHIIFPWGRVYGLPTDQHHHQLAEIMQQASTFREKFAKFTYLSTASNDTVGRMEKAWEASFKARDAEKKLRQAVKAGLILKHASVATQKVDALQMGILTEEEIELLEIAALACDEALKVDHFNKKGEVI